MARAKRDTGSSRLEISDAPAQEHLRPPQTEPEELGDTEEALPKSVHFQEPEQHIPSPEIPIGQRHRRTRQDVPAAAPTRKSALITPDIRTQHHDPRGRTCLIIAAITVVIFLVGIFFPNETFSPNNRQLTPAWWFEIFAQNVQSLFTFALGQGTPNSINVKVSQYLMCLFVGAALGASGAIYQGSLKNALASPSTLGVMAGAQGGVTLYALVFVGSADSLMMYNMADEIARVEQVGPWAHFLEMQSQSLCAMAGALIVAGFVLGVAYVAGRGRMSGFALIITGQIVMGLIGAVNQVVRYFIAWTAADSPQSYAMRLLQTSRLGSAFSWVDILCIAVPTLVALIVLWLMSSKLNALALGEDEARSLGINASVVRVVSVLLCTILTAVIVSFVGSIGFIGFFIPHLMRRIVGADLRYLMPASALGGAVFLVAAFTLICQYDSSGVSAIGVITSLIGAVAFFIVVARQKDGAGDGWI